MSEKERKKRGSGDAGWREGSVNDRIESAGWGWVRGNGREGMPGEIWTRRGEREEALWMEARRCETPSISAHEPGSILPVSGIEAQSKNLARQQEKRALADAAGHRVEVQKEGSKTHRQAFAIGYTKDRIRSLADTGLPCEWVSYGKRFPEEREQKEIERMATQARVAVKPYHWDMTRKGNLCRPPSTRRHAALTRSAAEPPVPVHACSDRLVQKLLPKATPRRTGRAASPVNSVEGPAERRKTEIVRKLQARCPSSHDVESIALADSRFIVVVVQKRKPKVAVKHSHIAASSPQPPSSNRVPEYRKALRRVILG
ncbi:hypothetical protein C8R47DRAFT_1076428 [Mycena vitilis]|nr:hypothetical protein C8R47DRAFT_1076428 [Mycena vitilis]